MSGEWVTYDIHIQANFIWMVSESQISPFILDDKINSNKSLSRRNLLHRDYKNCNSTTAVQTWLAMVIAPDLQVGWGEESGFPDKS